MQTVDPPQLHVGARRCGDLPGELKPFPTGLAREIDAEVAAIARAPRGSFIVPPQAFLSVHRARLIAAAERERLPAVYWNPLCERGRSGVLWCQSGQPIC